MKTAEQMFQDAKSQLETWATTGKMKNKFGAKGKYNTGFGGPDKGNETITAADKPKLTLLWSGLKPTYSTKYKSENGATVYLGFRDAQSGSGGDGVWDLLGETSDNSVGFVYHFNVQQAEKVD